MLWRYIKILISHTTAKQILAVSAWAPSVGPSRKLADSQGIDSWSHEANVRFTDSIPSPVWALRLCWKSFLEYLWIVRVLWGPCRAKSAQNHGLVAVFTRIYPNFHGIHRDFGIFCTRFSEPNLGEVLLEKAWSTVWSPEDLCNDEMDWNAWLKRLSFFGGYLYY